MKKKIIRFKNISFQFDLKKKQKQTIFRVDCILNKKITENKRGKLNSVLNALLTNISHLIERKHINSPIEWLLEQLRRQYQHS